VIDGCKSRAKIVVFYAIMVETGYSVIPIWNGVISFETGSMGFGYKSIFTAAMDERKNSGLFVMSLGLSQYQHASLA